MRRRLAILLALAAVLAGGIWSSRLTAQTEPLNLENFSPGVLGEDCSLFANPGGVVVSASGELMRCDPSDSKWVLLRSQISDVKVQVHGFCEAFGVDAGKVCYLDDHCTDHASCSGGNCDCIHVEPYRVFGVHDRLNAGGFGDDGLSFGVWYDEPDDVNIAYPGTSDTFGEMGNFLTTNIYYAGNRVARFQHPTMTLGAGGTTMNIAGTFVTLGVGSGASHLAGVMQGRLALQGDGSGNSYVSFAPLSTTSEFVGKLNQCSAGDSLCLEFWDGASSPARDVWLWRDGADSLALEGGKLDPISPAIVTGNRLVFGFGSSTITSANMETGEYLKFDDATATSANGRGMPRAGSVTAIAAMCDLSSCCTDNGTILMTVVKTGGAPSDLLTATSASITTGGVYTWSTTQARGTDTFAANDKIGVRVEDGTITVGAGSHCTGLVEVTFDD